VIDFLIDGGYAMWALLVSGALVLVLAGNAVRRLATADASGPRDAGVDAVLFWGMFSVVLGLIGTLVGIGQAARAIEAAGVVEPALARAGFRITLTTTIAGLGTGAISLVLWFALRTWQRFAARGHRGPHSQ
jgi:biopolymer transport protein ExbB/TolQ